MQGVKTIAVMAVLLAGAATGWAQRGRGRGNAPPPPPPMQRPAPQSPAGPPFANPPEEPEHHGGPVFHGPGPHFGDWLRKHEDQSPEERLKALERDPAFRNLPPQVQDRIRNRLQEFNTRTPEQQQQILQRMETFEHLTPEQQQKVRSMFRNFRSLPQERRRALNQGLRFLQGMPPDQRQKILDSDPFRTRFSEEERELLRGMSDIGFPGGPAPQKPAPPQ